MQLLIFVTDADEAVTAIDRAVGQNAQRLAVVRHDRDATAHRDLEIRARLGSPIDDERLRIAVAGYALLTDRFGVRRIVRADTSRHRTTTSRRQNQERNPSLHVGSSRRRTVRITG